MFQNIRLRTTLILSYFLVVIIALTVVGALALPLLLNNQDEKDKAAFASSEGKAASALDRVRNQLSNRPSGNVINPFKPYYGTPISATSNIYTYPQQADRQFVQDQFNQISAIQNLHLLVIHQGEIWLDTASDHSLVGFSLNKLYVSATPTTNSSSPKFSIKLHETEENKCPASNSQHCEEITLPLMNTQATIVFSTLDNFTNLNLFGINPQTKKPYEFIVAAVVPLPARTPILSKLIQILAIAGVAALIASFVAGIILARSIAQPLVKVTAATEAIARGDYKQTVPVQGGIELARLAESFNYMTQEVEQYQRMQRELIANVSHELKTPLTAIRGFSQAMIDGTLRRSEDFALPAQIINRETERTIRLVNSLLELSKLESGTARFNKEPLDINDILEGTLQSFMPKAIEDKVVLINQLQPVSLVLGDYDRLRQVFNNLIDNALKYTPPDGTITVSSRQLGSQIIVSIADTGRGIPEQDLPKVFERFYQADKSRSKPVDEAVGGLGLGLTICREIILAHGGKIVVSSKLDQGTKFTITLPALAEVSPKTTETVEPHLQTRELVKRSS